MKLSEINGICSVLNLMRKQVGLHPVGLSLVNMLVENFRFRDDTFIAKMWIIEPHGVVINYKLWVSQVLRQLLSRLVLGSHEVDIQPYRVNFITTTDLKILATVDAVERLPFFKWL